MVDDEDFERLVKYRWQATKIRNSFYATRNTYLGNYKSEHGYMHRMIMKTPKGMVTDHIDGDGLNNQKSNIRICTQRENSLNRPHGLQKNNYSGFVGVSWYSPSGKWRARTKMWGKCIHLGHFKTRELAYKEYINFIKNHS